MASLKSLNKLPNTRVFIAAEKWMVKPHANRRNIVGQQLPTLLDVACCVRLHTLLRVVTQNSKPVKLFSQQLPTFLLFRDRRSIAQQFAQLFQHCWELLHPFAHHCQHARNNSQHCCANNVGSCYARLHAAWEVLELVALFLFKTGTCDAKNSWQFFEDAILCFVKICFQTKGTNTT